MLNETLVVGRRTNVDISRLPNNTDISSPSQVDLIAQLYGELFIEKAEDYFVIYRNRFPWNRIADIAIGRTAYDNYLVAIGIVSNVSVIDATQTIVALHQTDHEGNKAGHTNSEKSFNKNRIGVFDYRLGYVSRCPLYTRRNQYADMQIEIRLNKELSVSKRHRFSRFQGRTISESRNLRIEEKS